MRISVLRTSVAPAQLAVAVCLAAAAAALADESAQHAHGTAHSDAHDHGSMPMATQTAGLDAVERAATAFPGGIEGLPDAVPPATVVLEDGDSYDITAAYVRKRVGERTLRMLAYNGSVPGPFIKAPENSQITINFRNDTDLDQTIHSHGIRIDNRYDGVPGITQDGVRPGESFSYVVRFPDAGVFWYHPHTREDYGQELGLYGNYLIEPSAPGYWGPVNREVPLVVDDILIENDRIASFYREFTNYALLGRFGNDFLVNGEQGYELAVKKGEVIRFFVTNVSNVRTFNLSLPGVQTKLVGADLGKLEHETFTDSLLISPAERLVIAAYFPKPGSYELVHTQPDGRVSLATLTVSADEEARPSHVATFARARHNDAVMAEFDALRSYLDAEPDRELLMTIDLGTAAVDHSMHTHSHTEDDLHDHGKHVAEATALPVDYQPLTPSAETLKSLQWSDPMQSDRTHRTPEISWKLVDRATGKASSEIDDWVFREGDLVKIRLVNDPDADHVMQHPMHLHGQQFAVLAVDGLPNNNLVWKDTTLVAPGQTVDILVKMSNPGEWMAHCHIAEHLHAGMALIFRVEDENGRAPGDEYRATALEGHHH
jgi:FtsP/CotA-like multicopper oxidase with cupredoxin domain